MEFFLSFFQTAALAAALSVDAFVACFAYGSQQIRIPLISAQVISLLCTGILGISTLLGAWVKNFIPPWLTSLLCFFILMALGVVKLLDGMVKAILRKHSSFGREIRFRLFHLRFVLSLYADPEKADQDHSKTISPKEAASLATALSLDGAAVGFGAALGNLSLPLLLFCSLLAELLAVLLGARLGNRLAKKLPFNPSWLGGALLLLLAFSKLG